MIENLLLQIALMKKLILALSALIALQNSPEPMFGGIGDIVSEEVEVLFGGVPSVTTETASIGTSDPQSTGSVTITSGSVVYITISTSLSGSIPPDDMSVSWSGGGGTFTKLGTVSWASRRRTWWYEVTGVSGTGTFVFNPTTSPQEIGWVVDEATGLNSTTPSTGFTSAGSNSSTATTITTATAPVAGDATMSSIAMEDNVNANPEAGWTALGQTTTGSLGVRRVESAWDSDADQSSAWTWDGSIIGNGAAIWILKASSEVSPTSTPVIPQIIIID